jgi:hypothetical protein
VQLLIVKIHLSPSRVMLYLIPSDSSLVPLYLIMKKKNLGDEKKKKTNHSISGFGVPITSASKRIVLPSLPSASFNFLRNSGGVAAFASLT